MEARPKVLVLKKSFQTVLDLKIVLKSVKNKKYSLQTWSNRSSPCNWTGVFSSAMVPHGHGPGDAVQAMANISLEWCSLEGTLDKLQFADLSELSVLDLSNNFLDRSIPPSRGNLTKLTYLDLSNNDLSGSIPAFIGNLTKLTYLLSNNNLSGFIQASIGDLSKLIPSVSLIIPLLMGSRVDTS
jgi:Leucine-rich repeat (LRR) protein